MTFSTGLSALRANQTALNVVGHNIANASTEGYRRQEVLFVENPPTPQGGFLVGTGVSIGEIREVGHAVLEAALTSSASDGAALATRLQSAKQLEALFIPGTGTLQERTEELFLTMERLTALPSDASLRSAVIHGADGLAKEINRVTATLDGMSAQIEQEIQRTIETINSLSASISKLNDQIESAESGGQTAHSLRSERNLLLSDLAELIDVERVTTSDGKESFVMGGGLFSITSGLSEMRLERNASGELEVWKNGCDAPHKIAGGRLEGLLAQVNDSQGMLRVRNKVDEFTAALVGLLDTAHATGVGINGGFENLRGARRLDPSTVLAGQSTMFPLEAGTLTISVTDQNSGTPTSTQLQIDPQTDSLADVAALISSVDRISASVDSLGRLLISAEPGYSFDFTGNLQTRPDLGGITGTTQPTISGRYTGEENDEFSFRFVGSGTVGITDGLKLEVLDQNNAVVRILDVGTDYEPASDLNVGDGVLVALSSGTANDGDTFRLSLAAAPDETGILAALGMNTLFVGESPATIAVNPRLLENSALLATTTNGDPSDTWNLQRMLATRDALVLRDGTATLEQFLAELVSDVGREVADLTGDVESQDERHAFLQSELDAIIGVDVNEELARMLQYQRSYQAAARYIVAIDESLQQLFAIIR